MDPRRPLRIAVLECDEPIGTTKTRYGGYGELFEEFLRKGMGMGTGSGSAGGAEGVEVELEVRKYDVVVQQVYPSLEEVDAVLLTGSRHNSFDNDAWILQLVAFTKTVLEQDRVRAIGVCFGHQIIARALDAHVNRSDRGWEISVTKVQLTEQGTKLFGKEVLAIHQMHRDIVYEHPPGMEALGHSPQCAVQGMYAKKRLITLQGHPEFTGDIVAELLEKRREIGLFDDALYQDGMTRVRDEHDGVAIAAVFLRFLRDA